MAEVAHKSPTRKAHVYGRDLFSFIWCFVSNPSSIYATASLYGPISAWIVQVFWPTSMISSKHLHFYEEKKKKHGKCLTGFGEYHFAVKILHTGLKHKPPLPLFISLRRLKCTLLRNFSMKMRYFLRREQIHCLLCSSDFITTLASAMLPQDQDYIRPIPTFMHINLSLNILQEFACCKTSHVIKSC